MHVTVVHEYSTLRWVWLLPTFTLLCNWLNNDGGCLIVFVSVYFITG